MAGRTGPPVYPYHTASSGPPDRVSAALDTRSAAGDNRIAAPEPRAPHHDHPRTAATLAPPADRLPAAPRGQARRRREHAQAGRAGGQGEARVRVAPAVAGLRRPRPAALPGRPVQEGGDRVPPHL